MAEVTLNATPNPPLESVTLTLTPQEADSLLRMLAANMDGHSIVDFLAKHEKKVTGRFRETPPPYNYWRVTSDVERIAKALRDVPVVI